MAKRYRPGPSAVSGGALICNECGCLVHDVTAHDRFHLKVEEALRRAKR